MRYLTATFVANNFQWPYRRAGNAVLKGRILKKDLALFFFIPNTDEPAESRELRKIMSRIFVTLLKKYFDR